MPTISRPRALLYATVVLVALLFAGRFVLAGRSDSPPPAATLSARADTAPSTGQSDRAATAPLTDLVVHVAGAVKRPGLYTLPAGSRIEDAVKRAGGPTRRAELDLVNLAQPLSDGEQVLIPARAAPGAVAAPSTAPDAGPTGPVHLNSASLEELDTLPGVGPVTAQKIVDYREQHGPFSNVDELDAIPGIGPARLGQLRDLVVP